MEVKQHIPTESQPVSIFDEVNQSWLYDYASTGQRFLHFLIDTIILNNLFSGIAGFFIGIIMVLMGYNPAEYELFTHPVYSRLFNYLLGSVCIVISYTLIEGASRGRSLGKLITRTQVVREDGSSIGYRDAFRRALCRIIPFEVFSALSGAPWHDTMTHTMVIKKPVNMV